MIFIIIINIITHINTNTEHNCVQSEKRKIMDDHK